MCHQTGDRCHQPSKYIVRHIAYDSYYNAELTKLLYLQVNLKLMATKNCQPAHENQTDRISDVDIYARKKKLLGRKVTLAMKLKLVRHSHEYYSKTYHDTCKASPPDFLALAISLELPVVKTAYHASRQKRVNNQLDSKQTSTPAFPSQKAAVKLTALTAQTTEAGLKFNLLYIFENFRQSTRIKRQSFFDWRTKQKPSRRAGLIITAIRDSPGLIGGRLEPQRGRSLTVKAVCGSTLGWKDPPFNSMLALPGATHQDPTQNEIINNLISNKLNTNDNLKANNYFPIYQNIGDNYIGNDNYAHWAQINWLENKMCRHLDDSYQLPDNYCNNNNYAGQSARINWLENKMCRHIDDSYQLPNSHEHYARIFWLKDKICHARWLENKMRRQLDDSYRLPDNYIQINWLEHKICAGNDSYYTHQVIIPNNLILHENYVGNDMYTVKILICHIGDDRYHTKLSDRTVITRAGSVKHPRQINPNNWLKNKMCRKLDDSCQSTRKNIKRKINRPPSIPTGERTSKPAFPSRQAARLKLKALTAQSPEVKLRLRLRSRSTNRSHIFVNFRQLTKKNSCSSYSTEKRDQPVKIRKLWHTDKNASFFQSSCAEFWRS